MLLVSSCSSMSSSLPSSPLISSSVVIHASFDVNFLQYEVRYTNVWIKWKTIKLGIRDLTKYYWAPEKRYAYNALQNHLIAYASNELKIEQQKIELLMHSIPWKLFENWMKFGVWFQVNYRFTFRKVNICRSLCRGMCFVALM